MKIISQEDNLII